MLMKPHCAAEDDFSSFFAAAKYLTAAASTDYYCCLWHMAVFHSMIEGTINAD